ncbi:MAG: hypothetical protein NWE86_07180 [Candidatus Bathyarchaeota archaeon]|nr:hypothetical protein [Candidatus Bathyarchaeota archaeon]
MTKFLIKWKVESFFNLPREERLKLFIWMAESTKTNIDAGLTKDWGISADTGSGYTIYEGTETEVYENLIKYRPFISFEVTPVISIDKHLEILKKMAAQVKPE